MHAASHRRSMIRVAHAPMRYGPRMPCAATLRCIVALLLGAAASAAIAFDLQGHRGARGLAPENTLPAFRRAIELGVTTLETDVGVTADDVLVIAHDRRLNPALTRGDDGRWIVAPGPPLRTLRAGDLAAFDVGRIDPSSSYAPQWPEQRAVDGSRIPRIDDLFALARPTRVRLNIETKLSPVAPDETVDAKTFARLLVDAVRAAKLADRTTIQSFDWRTLVEAKRIDSAIRTACLTQEGGNGDTVKPDGSGRSPWHAGLSLAEAGSLPKLVRAAGCDVWSPFWRNVDADRVREAHALGIQVVPWTVNEPADMAAVIDLNVDGLITDYPDRARRVLESKGMPLP
jgi:glycerophosphoryl diester phosphodiesterase